MEVNLVGIHREKEGLAFVRIERKTPILRLALQSKQSSLRGPHRCRNRRGGKPNGQIVSVKRVADRRRRRNKEFINKEREKCRAKNGSLRNTSTDYSKGTTFCDFCKPHKRSCQKGKIESNEQSKKGGQPI